MTFPDISFQSQKISHLSLIKASFFIADLEDFEAGTHNVIFSPGDVRQCLNVTILNDEVAEEREENFVASISRVSDPAVEVVESTTTVIIIDDDCKSVLSLKELSIIINET